MSDHEPPLLDARLLRVFFYALLLAAAAYFALLAGLIPTPIAPFRPLLLDLFTTALLLMLAGLLLYFVFDRDRWRRAAHHVIGLDRPPDLADASSPAANARSRVARFAQVIRDLLTHYGEHHPSVSGTALGRDIAFLGAAIPFLAWRDLPTPLAGKTTTLDHDIQQLVSLEALFLRYGWLDVPVYIDSVVDLAGCLMNLEGDRETFLANRRHQFIRRAVLASPFINEPGCATAAADDDKGPRP